MRVELNDVEVDEYGAESAEAGAIGRACGVAGNLV